MSSRVCVTGAAGYIAAWLVRKLLERGCVVHATLRNLGTCLPVYYTNIDRCRVSRSISPIKLWIVSCK